MNPSLTQNRKASAKETLRTAGRGSFSRGPPASLDCATLSSLLAILCPFRFLLTPTQDFIQADEDRNGMPEQLPVVFEQFGQPANHQIEPVGFRPVKLAILEIHVVDDFGHLAQPRVTTQS